MLHFYQANIDMENKWIIFPNDDTAVLLQKNVKLTRLSEISFCQKDFPVFRMENAVVTSEKMYDK